MFKNTLKKHKKKSLLLVVFVILSTLFLFILKTSNKNENHHKFIIKESLDKGISFIISKQYSFGGFKTLMCNDKEMKDCSVKPVLFTTLNILMSISTINESRLEGTIRKSLKLIQQQQDSNGLWDFYIKEAYTPEISKEIQPHHDGVYYPDLDDTSLASFLLEKYHFNFRKNKEIINENRISSKREYLTFYKTEQPPAPHFNYTDTIVNAHTLMYIKQKDNFVCDFIKQQVNNKQKSLYYTDKIIEYYLIARAYKNGVDCIKESRDFIINNSLDFYRTNTMTLNTIQEASLYLIFDYFKYNQNKIKKDIIKKIISTQLKDGSWPTNFFFTGPIVNYGSEELTTAIALEAVNNYYKKTFNH